MSSTPLETIADALIEFILSLLRDPDASAQFAAAPEDTLERRGLGGVTQHDVRSVMPVIVDHPAVTARPATAATTTYQTSQSSVVEEITNVTNTFHIDNRSMILDQSVNQTIWAQGDVTQLFDQGAVVATGDGAVAAGDDAALDSSSTSVQAGDIAIGNTQVTAHLDAPPSEDHTPVADPMLTATPVEAPADLDLPGSDALHDARASVADHLVDDLDDGSTSYGSLEHDDPTLIDYGQS